VAWAIASARPCWNSSADPRPGAGLAMSLSGEERRARVVVLSGPSAVGKSTVVRCLRDRVPDLYFSVSVTTRAPRPGETDGVDYHFVTPDEFQRLIDDGALLEWADIHGGLHRSGTPAQPVREATSADRPVLIEVDLAGARAIKQAMPEVFTVFLAPPSWEALEARLKGRGTESSVVMARRLATAREELAAQNDFDTVVVNSELESACAKLIALLEETAPDPA
jgi:guanylate kinase